jgi:NADPH-dependent curcumin reductase
VTTGNEHKDHDDDSLHPASPYDSSPEEAPLRTPQIGQVIVGGTVSRVVASNNEAFAVGDVVEAHSGWQDYALSDGKGLRKVGPSATWGI